VFLAMMLFPIYWMINASLQQSGNVLTADFFPWHPSFAGYEKAIADQFLGWLLAKGPGGSGYNARRLGVMYLIWNGKIWGSYRASEGWRAYTGGESHSDHIHISLSWNGAMKRTSWWTGQVAAVDYGPCPAVDGEMPPSSFSSALPGPVR